MVVLHGELARLFRELKREDEARAVLLTGRGRAFSAGGSFDWFPTLEDMTALEHLRREIRRLMVEGKTDAEIFDFLVTRYGEFALYRPRMSGKTLVLWIAPLALLLGGALLVFAIVRKRTQLPVDEIEAPQDGPVR